MMAGVAAISAISVISPDIWITSSSSSSGASRAGTVTLQNALAATLRADCSTADSAAAFAASFAYLASYSLVGVGLKPAQ